MGNKKDLASEKRQVTFDEALTFAKEKNFIFQEVSAKEGTNINDLFYIDVLNKLSEKHGLKETIQEEEINVDKKLTNKNDKGFKIGDVYTTKNPKEKKKCCK